MYAASPSSSFPCIKFHNPLSSSTSSSSSSSPSSCSSSSFRFSATNPTTIFTIRNSQAEGPFRRPVAPPPVKPVPPSTPVSSPVTSPPPPPPTPTPSARVAVADKNVITLEFQRQKAKELQEYFKKKKLEDASQGPFFGFIGKNEIANGRWAMFGFAVGMLTEYATGSDFVDQVKILLSNFGIVDLE